MIRVSVCMATYNGERFIERQLKSILSQLASNDEVIISDDSSSDGTIDIIAQFNDSRVRVLQGHRFRSAMLNFENAIRHARGQYVVLSDQDDIWMSDKIEVITKLLETNDLVLSDCCVVNDKAEIIHPSFFTYRNSAPGFWYNLYRNSYIGCCMAFRREVTAYMLPFPKHIHMHDWWIGLLVELKGQVYFHPQPLIQYVRHGKNASPTAEGTTYSFKQQLVNRVIMFFHVIRRVVLYQLR